MMNQLAVALVPARGGARPQLSRRTTLVPDPRRRSALVPAADGACPRQIFPLTRADLGMPDLVKV